MSAKLRITASLFATICLSASTAAAVAAPGDAESKDEAVRGDGPPPTLRGIEQHRRAAADYRRAFKRANKAGVAPKRRADLIDLRIDQVRKRTGELHAAVRDEAAAGRAKAERQGSFPTPESVGVSSATLSAIASCESGGSPTAVNAAGYYGKYQFDAGTWAGVGGSGLASEASEAEQDYRAALLYARAGSSPWPVCGR